MRIAQLRRDFRAAGIPSIRIHSFLCQGHVKAMQKICKFATPNLKTSPAPEVFDGRALAPKATGITAVGGKQPSGRRAVGEAWLKTMVKDSVLIHAWFSLLFIVYCGIFIVFMLFIVFLLFFSCVRSFCLNFRCVHEPCTIPLL